MSQVRASNSQGYYVYYLQVHVWLTIYITALTSYLQTFDFVNM